MKKRRLKIWPDLMEIINYLVANVDLHFQVPQACFSLNMLLLPQGREVTTFYLRHDKKFIC